MKRVLITGITGFLGSHLARCLLQDAQVFGLARLPFHMNYLATIQDRLTLLPYDGSYESIETALQISQPDCVYHLATHYTGAHSKEEMPCLLDANIILGAYLLEAMTNRGYSHLVYATTVMEHARGEAYCPLNLYAATKRALSDLLTYYTDANLLHAITLVLSDTYGPGDLRPKILNLILQAVEEKKTIALSEGSQDYDVVYIDDVIKAFCLAGKRLCEGSVCHESFQVFRDPVLTLRETVERFLTVNALTVQAQWGARPPAERSQQRAVRMFPPVPGWCPEVSLDEGLRRLWQGRRKEVGNSCI